VTITNARKEATRLRGELDQHNDPATLLSEAMYKKDGVRPFPAITNTEELRGVLVSPKRWA